MSVDLTTHLTTRTAFVELNYPRNSDVDKIVVNLCDVRAADGLMIQYDFARNGWSISQSDGEDWQEVAFAQAWALEKKKESRP